MAAVNRTTPGLSGVSVPVAGLAPIINASQTAQHLFDRCLEVDRQLRSLLRKKSFFDLEVRQLKQQLRDLYEAVIFKDYPLAQTHDVEQLMWKTVFYHTIEGFRQRIQSATKAGETGREALKKVTAAYLKYLDDARLFYKQLLYKLQAVYGDVEAAVELDLTPALPEFASSNASCDCRISAQRCLIYLGDLSRYKAQVLRGNRSDWQLASGFYKQAGRVYPRSGNPFNQLGVIAFYLKDELRAVCYYFRSLSVATPFLTARENLKLLFEKNRGRFSYITARGISRQSSWSNALDAKQTMSNITAELSVCFVRMSGILFDGINSEQFDEAKRLGFEVLKQVLAAKPAVELLAAAPATENILLHLLVLGVFSVYNTENRGARQPGRTSGSDSLQLRRFHHQAAGFAFQYAAFVCEALSATVEAGHAPLSAVVLLVLQWIQAQPQLVKEQGKEVPADKIGAQTTFWKALCKLFIRCGEAARRSHVEFRQKMVGSLPEELEFLGFEPFRIDETRVAAVSLQTRSNAQLRLVRIIQGCRHVAEIMQPYVQNFSTPTDKPVATSAARESGLAAAADMEAYKASIHLFCTAVDLLYANGDFSAPAFQALDDNLLLNGPDKTSVASSLEQSSSPLNTGMSASTMLGPQSGSTYRSTTFSSTGADGAANLEESVLLDSASADMQDLLVSDTGAAAAAAALQAATAEPQTGLDKLSVKVASTTDGLGSDDGEEEEEEVIVFQPQSISRPPSRAPEPAAPSGSAGVSRAASAASFPVSPTVAAHQQFNLFANDASLALHKWVTSGGVQLEQQPSLDSLRSEISGSVHAREQLVSTPRGQTASPASSLKVSPAARQLPEPPAEWTSQLPPALLGLNQLPSGKHSSKSSPQINPLPAAGSMPPPPPTSLQVAAMSNTHSTPSTSTTGGYGFGAIGGHRTPTTSQPALLLPGTMSMSSPPVLIPEPVPSRALNLPILPSVQSPLPVSTPVASPAGMQTAITLQAQEPVMNLLQQLQIRPSADVPSTSLSVPTAATAHGSNLPSHPASPSLRGMASHPAVPMPSRLSLSSSEQTPPPHAPPAPTLLQPGRFTSPPLSANQWPVNTQAGTGMHSIAPTVPAVVPAPGFGDMLTLAQLEQATLAAHEESVANDQAEATAMAAIGQLLDDPPPPSYAPIAGALISLSITPTVSQYPTALPPMPSEKFLPAPAQLPVPPVSIPTIPLPATSAHIEPSPFCRSSPATSPAAAVQYAPLSHPLDALQASASLPQQYSPQSGPHGFAIHAADPLRASLPMPGGLLAKTAPSGPFRQSSFPPPGSAGAGGPILSFASVPHAPQAAERDAPATGFSFLDILEARQTQGVDYGGGAHLYNAGVAEVTAASFPMLVPSANIVYRTAEPLPQ